MDFKFEIGCWVVDLSWFSKNHKENKRNRQQLWKKWETTELRLKCCMEKEEDENKCIILRFIRTKNEKIIKLEPDFKIY